MRTITDERTTASVLADMMPRDYGDADTVQVAGDYFTLNTRKYLEDRLEFLPEWQARFEAWRDEHSDDWTPHLRDVADFLEFMGYEEGKDYRITNTYNSECNLEDTLQYVELVSEQGSTYGFDSYHADVIIMSVHQGGDVRGNYGAPHFFEPTVEVFGYDVADASVWCDWEPEAPQGETLPDMPPVTDDWRDKHRFELMGGVDVCDGLGDFVELTSEPMTDENGEPGDYVMACPACLEAGRVTPLQFFLPHPC